MKKSLILIILVFAFKASNSQQKLGIKSGMNISTTKNSIAYPSNKIGWYAGAFYEQPLGARSVLHFEILYSQKGDKTDNSLGGPFHRRYFNYLSLPILFGYKIDPKTKIYLGPEICYLQKVKIFGSNSSDNYPVKIDIGLSVGIGYQIFKNLGTDIRYIYGFNTFYYVNNSGTRLSDKRGAHRVFQMGLYYDLFNKNQN